MKKCNIGMIVLSLILIASVAHARDSFDTKSVRGRYVGHIGLGATFFDGTSTQRLDAQLLTALTFDGAAAIEGSGNVTVSVPGTPVPFTCPFAMSGTYQIGEDGLGSGTMVLAPSDAACGDGTGVTLQLSLVVGGHNRRRLDVKVNGATDPNGEVLPLVGTGTLEK